MSITRLALAFGVCAALVALPVEAHAQEGTIVGAVLVGEARVDDADVAIQALGRRVRVDGAGRFSFERVPPGSYVVTAESPRWGRGIETVRVDGDQTVEVTVRLEAVFHLDEVVVSAGASGTRRSEAYQPASVVTARDLVASGEASLGETLSREPGVSSTYFGPGSSRPIIRGLGGDRVRILTGGIGVGDASSTSPDHAVGIEARGASRIEVVRGPATLLYGSSAVGGVVNVLDDNIARDPPTQRVTGYVEGLGGTVADERTGSFGLTVSEGPLVATASGLWRDASDYAIPGFALSEPPPGTSVSRGRLENSALRNRRRSIGVTVLGEVGYIGLVGSAQRSDYGIPGQGGAAEEAITIDLDQDRLDLEGALRLGPGIVRNVKARLGVADYVHVELEGDQVGTTFVNDYVEARVESEHSFDERTQGAVGLQFTSRDFEAVGDEAFVPPSETRSFALFAYEELRSSERLALQLGLRFERQGAQSGASPATRSDNAVSASLGASWDASEWVSFALSTSRSVKVPNAEELFSNGPHAATRAFEIGNPDLVPEVAYGMDLTTHLHGERFRVSASVFATRFSSYIYEAATGNVQDGLSEFAFVQGDARFLGYELEGELDILEGDHSAGEPHVSVELLSDRVDAKLTDVDQSLPRIPPMRLGAGVNLRRGSVSARTSIRRTMEQDDTGPFETSTAGFNNVDASVSYRVFTGRVFHDLTLVAKNLTNGEARLHTSFLRDFAPLPGRELRLVYRLNF